MLLLTSRRRVLDDIMVNKHKAYRRKNESIIIIFAGGSFVDSFEEKREKICCRGALFLDVPPKSSS